MIRRTTLLLTVVALTALGFASPVLAAPGDLDTSFSGDGKLTTPVGSSHDGAFDIAVQSDGKLVAAGTAYSEQMNAGGDPDDAFALARYNANGTPDASFSGDGKLTTNLVSGNDEARAIAVQPDGKIVVAGLVNNGAPPRFYDFALTRYNANGTLDGSFDGDGKLTTDFVGGDDIAYALTLQPNGKIVVAGSSTDSSRDASSSDFALARYNANGTPDTSFDGDGELTTDFVNPDFGGFGKDVAHDLIVQSDGKIVATGSADSFGTFALARYNANGTPDTSFDGDGKLTTDFAGSIGEEARALDINPDGKLIVAGVARESSTDFSAQQDFALARYNANGTPDASFSGDGELTTDFVNSDLATDVAVQPDGRIVLTGAVGFPSTEMEPSHYDFGVARYSVNGALDTRFSGDGKQITSIGSRSAQQVAIAIQPNGRLVAAGGAFTGAGLDFALARYYGGDDATPPATTINSGPLGFVNSASASFGFSSSESGSSFQCSLDNAAYSSCTSPKSYSALANGSSHTFRVRATDPNGNTDPTPASRTWTVDTVVPRGTISINGGNASTASRSVTLRLSASDPTPASGVAYMRFRNENTTTWSAWQTYATSKSWTLSSGTGTKTVYVQYQDRAGNVSAATSDSINYSP